MTPAILQILPALISGGVERGTIEIAEAIRDAGMRPIVASAGGPLVAELERLGARHVTLPLTTKSPLGLLRNAAALARLTRAENVAIIHARSRAPAWSALLAARRTGARFVTTYHGSYSEGLPGKRLYNSVMARGDRVIAISGYIASLIRDRHGVPESRIRLIPRGVDPRRFDPGAGVPEAVAAQRAAWRADGQAIILLPGRLSRWKGHAVLIEAMAHLPETAIAVFAGGGEGSLRSELEAQAQRLGVLGKIRFAGHVTDMATAMRAADIVVHASTQAEAFGRIVIEAQAMARPVIAADLGGPRETVEQGVTGWRVPPGDAAALAEALVRVLAMPESARQAIGAAARDAVLRRYSTAAMQAATIGVYRELLP